jgi:threonine dehydrogenase-like Zn-dependent dehydrogenase
MENIMNKHIVDKKSRILVKISHAGICQSDRRVLNNGKAHALNNTLALGHEAGGYIIDPGTCEFLFAGRKVVILPHFTCGKCNYCKEGKTNLCHELLHVGFHINGIFADVMDFPVQCAYPAPDDFDDAALCLIEPLACVNHALAGITSALERLLLENKSGKPQFTVLGGGSMGCLTALMVQRLYPAIPVCIIEKNERRQKVIMAQGICDCINNNIEESSPGTVCFIATSELDGALQMYDKTRNGETILLFSGINSADLNQIDNHKASQGRMLEHIHREELIVSETDALGKKRVLIGSSGYTFADVDRAIHELSLYPGLYKKVQTTFIYGLDAKEAFYVPENRFRSFGCRHAVSALMAADNIYDKNFGNDIADTLKVVVEM